MDTNGGVVIGGGKIVERGNRTIVHYNDGKREIFDTVGEFKFHPMGWLVLDRPAGQSPLLIRMEQILRFNQEKLPIEEVSPILAG